MRLLTLAEELLSRGHEPVLHADLGGVEWLERHVASAGVPVVPTTVDVLDAEDATGFDCAVVDSYRIPADDVGILDARIPVLAVVDGDDRGIRASAYLDQNLGAERAPRPPHVAPRLLAGSSYALVRREVRRQRRTEPWRLGSRPEVVVVVGGTDPDGAIVGIAESLAAAAPRARLTFVCAPSWAVQVADRLAGLDARVLAPTPDLPAIMGAADVVVSATGTSAWDVATTGVPAVFVAVVGNQQAGLAGILEAGIALGVDAADDPRALDRVGGLVGELLDDEGTRRRISERALGLFDGRGAERVVDALERLASPATRP